MPVSFCSQASSSNDVPFSAASACLIWHPVTHAASVLRCLATASSHLAVFASGGTNPLSSGVEVGVGVRVAVLTGARRVRRRGGFGRVAVVAGIGVSVGVAVMVGVHVGCPGPRTLYVNVLVLVPPRLSSTVTCTSNAPEPLAVSDKVLPITEACRPGLTGTAAH